MISYIRKIVRNRHIIAALVRQDMLSRYRRSVLGMLWSVLMPLGTSLIIGAVYSVLWQTDITDFLPFLFSGLTAWNYISECMNAGTVAYIGAEGYIKQLPVDIEIFPIRVACVSMINLGFGLIAFYAMLLIVNPALFTLNTLLLIPAMLILGMFGVGMSTITATAQVYTRDYAPLQSLILQALFYVSPIIYDPTMLRNRGFGFVYEFNPFYYYIQLVRDALIGKAPQLSIWLIALGISLVVWLFAIYLSNRTRRKIVFRL